MIRINKEASAQRAYHRDRQIPGLPLADRKSILASHLPHTVVGQLLCPAQAPAEVVWPRAAPHSACWRVLGRIRRARDGLLPGGCTPGHAVA